jgi:hypothetical protein
MGGIGRFIRHIERSEMKVRKDKEICVRYMEIRDTYWKIWRKHREIRN